MPLFKKERLQSPVFIFVLYVAVAFCLMLGFRTIFPGEAPPLPILSTSWWITRWLMDIVALFPALALSALVIPFCTSGFREEDPNDKFSPDLFKKRFSVPIITAISASALYALLFFLVLPLAQNHERNMRFDGEIYRMAVSRARYHIEAEEWVKASHFIGLSNSVWENSPELVPLRNEVEINLEQERMTRRERPVMGRPDIALSDIPGQWDPVDTAEAMAMSRAAYDEGRLFDAHWLATLGRRLAGNNSPEQVAAAQFAARTWNLIESQRPTENQRRMHELFELKLYGYRAMQSGDWVRAFFTFQELTELTPADPDVRNFLELSTRELDNVAFFTDEMTITVGNTITGVVFSLPAELGAWRGRAVLRLASLSSTPDVAFGVGLEYMLFDHQSRLMLHLHAPYAKFRPLSIGFTGYPEARRQYVTVLMRALDRNDHERYWEPTVEFSAGDFVYRPGSAQLILNVGYETFLLLSQMRQEISGMHLGELFEASRLSVETGYIPQVFEAEILNRLGSGLFFLPVAIAAIVAGWYFRTWRFPRFLFSPLLVVLPVVFNAIAHAIRAGLNIIGISLTLAVGFPVAIVIFSAILALAFFCSLFLLAAQRN